MSLSIILKVYDGGKLKLARAFKTAQVKLGTGDDADLQLAGVNVAGHHALIELGAMGAVLRASSASPLFLNGQPILAAPLRTGDLITLGSLRVMVELREPQVAPAPQQKRQRFQVIDGDSENVEHLHALPSLSVVREGGHGSTAEALPLELEMLPPAPQHAPPAAHVHAPASMASQSPTSAALPMVDDTPAAVVMAAPGLMLETERPSSPPMAAPGSLSAIGFAMCELRWGDQLLAVHCLEPGRALTAGDGVGCDAFIPGMPKAQLVVSDSNGWTLRAPQSVAMSLIQRGESVGGRELLARGWGRIESDGLVASLPWDACGVMRAGTLSLRVRVVPEATKVGTAREEWRGVAMTSLAAALFVGGMAVMHRVMPQPLAPPVQEIHRPLIVRASMPKQEVTPPARTPEKAMARRDPGKAFARHRGQEGEAGSKTAPRRNLRAEKSKSDASIVAESGLLKALKGKGKGTTDAFGVALAAGTRDAMGHLDGPKVGNARGDGGMGLKSLGGVGGGGDGSGLGLARIGTNGIGGGLADYGEGRGALKGKANAAIGLGNGKPQVIGELDPELIRKVVHDHRAQIRACYEEELNTRPKLAGKVTSAWTIDPQGLVTESHVGESTLNDSAVEKCVTSRIKTWRFPLPKGGGEVYVTYPFIFTRGG